MRVRDTLFPVFLVSSALDPEEEEEMPTWPLLPLCGVVPVSLSKRFL